MPTAPLNQPPYPHMPGMVAIVPSSRLHSALPPSRLSHGWLDDRGDRDGDRAGRRRYGPDQRSGGGRNRGQNLPARQTGHSARFLTYRLPPPDLWQDREPDDRRTDRRWVARLDGGPAHLHA